MHPKIVIFQKIKECPNSKGTAIADTVQCHNPTTQQYEHDKKASIWNREDK